MATLNLKNLFYYILLLESDLLLDLLLESDLLSDLLLESDLLLVNE